MANIEPGLPCAIIGEGAAVRLGAEAGRMPAKRTSILNPARKTRRSP